MITGTGTAKIRKTIQLVVLALLLELAATLKAQTLYVTIYGSETIGEYTASGQTVNASLIAVSGRPEGIAISGNDLFVSIPGSLAGTGIIGEYTLSGAAVNASLITGLYHPQGIAISGNDLFVANENNTIGEYTTSGATVNASLITSGLEEPNGIAISGNDLYVANNGNSAAHPAQPGYVGEYTTSGATINASLITGVSYLPEDIAISGNDLFVANAHSPGAVGEYTTSGQAVNASLISSGLNVPFGIAISGNDMFIANYGNGTLSPGSIGEYTTSGATVNAMLITGLIGPTAIAIGPPLPVAPVLSWPGFSNGEFQMTVTGSSNQTYTVQMTTNPISTNWASLLITNPPSGSFLFTDPNATNQQQFYRAEIVQ